LSQAGRIFEAKKLFKNMHVQGCMPNVLSYNILINGSCKALRIDEAKQLFDEMSFRGLIPNTASYNTLISGLFQVGRILEAEDPAFQGYACPGLLP
jgi:pentatricopeptide repeat protein